MLGGHGLLNLRFAFRVPAKFPWNAALLNTFLKVPARPAFPWTESDFSLDWNLF